MKANVGIRKPRLRRLSEGSWENKDGKELNEDDVKKIDAYKKRYSNRDLPENVNKA